MLHDLLYTLISVTAPIDAILYPLPRLDDALNVFSTCIEKRRLLNTLNGSRLTTAQLSDVLDAMAAEVPWIPPRSSCPVLKLPFEILSHIMELTLKDQPVHSESPLTVLEAVTILSRALHINRGVVFRDLHPDAMEVDESQPSPSVDVEVRRAQPVILSHVCGYWREVAKHTALLWLNIPFHPDAAAEYMQRSSPYGVSIQMDAIVPTMTESDNLYNIARVTFRAKMERVRAFFKVILPHRARWKDFHATSNTLWTMFFILRRLSDDAHFTLLERICLYLDPPETLSILPQQLAEMYSWLAFDTVTAPRLRMAVVGGGYHKLLSAPVLKGLTDLELGHTTRMEPLWTELAALFAHCCLLRRLILSAVEPEGDLDDYDDWMQTTYELKALTSLVFHQMYHETALAIIQQLHVPALVSLWLGVCHGCNAEDGSDLILHLMTRAESLLPRLHELGLVNMQCSDDVAMAAFRELNALRRLSVLAYIPSGCRTCCAWDPMPFLFTAHITEDREVRLSCPRLEALAWHPADESTTSILLSVRRAWGLRLESLSLGDELKEAVLEKVVYKQQVGTLDFLSDRQKRYFSDVAARSP